MLPRGEVGGGPRPGAAAAAPRAGGGLVSREYLWGATVFDTDFDRAYAPAADADLGRALAPAAGGGGAGASSGGRSEFQTMVTGPPGVPAAAALAAAAFAGSKGGGGSEGGANSPLPVDLRYSCWWAHDAASEAAAFAGFVDWLTARRARWPDLKVYHYGAYEVGPPTSPLLPAFT